MGASKTCMRHFQDESSSWSHSGRVDEARLQASFCGYSIVYAGSSSKLVVILWVKCD
jgi:hypothetical protein